MTLTFESDLGAMCGLRLVLLVTKIKEDKRLENHVEIDQSEIEVSDQLRLSISSGCGN